MAEHSVSSAERTFLRSAAVLGAGVREDLRHKQVLLSAACRCLEDEQSYRFFDTLASLARMTPDKKLLYLDFLEAMGAYQAHELAAIRRLITGEGATAFKDLVDIVRDIRVQHEIDTMVRQTGAGGAGKGKASQVEADGRGER